MAKFYVGQRVKLVRPNYPINLGLTGSIRELGLHVDTIHGVADCVVAWDKKPWLPIPMDRVFNNTNQLEPLCKDDDQVGSWDALEELGLDVDTIREAVYVSGAER